MKKTILALALIVFAPVTMFAQKFGQLNSEEIIPLMAEFTQAQTELENLQKQYADELQYLENEYTKKIEEYQKQQATLPDDIKARREQELMESQQKASQFYQDCQTNLQNKSAELMGNIQSKVKNAIEKVGEEGGFVCIFDSANGMVPYISTSLTTDVTVQVKEKLGIK